MELLVAAVAWIMPYFTITAFLGGVAFKAVTWFLKPMPVKWTLYPAPASRFRRFTRILQEVFALRSHLRGSRRLWVGALVLHVCLVTSFSLHAFVNLWFAPIYEPMLELTGLTERTIQYAAFLAGGAAGIAATVTVIYPFLLNRVFTREVRDISSFMDYGSLVLLLATIAVGAQLRLFQIVDPGYLRAYLGSLALLNPIAPPAEPLFLLHLLLAQIYLIYFPFSKPMHFIGLLINQMIVTTS